MKTDTQMQPQPKFCKQVNFGIWMIYTDHSWLAVVDNYGDMVQVPYNIYIYL